MVGVVGDSIMTHRKLTGLGCRNNLGFLDSQCGAYLGTRIVGERTTISAGNDGLTEAKLHDGAFFAEKLPQVRQQRIVVDERCDAARRIVVTVTDGDRLYWAVGTDRG